MQQTYLLTFIKQTKMLTMMKVTLRNVPQVQMLSDQNYNITLFTSMTACQLVLTQGLK